MIERFVFQGYASYLTKKHVIFKSKQKYELIVYKNTFLQNISF